jgi:DnaA regulatory inactivator Hda
MQQLVLDIAPPPPPRFDNFVAASNAEVVHAIRAITLQNNREPQLYLWGAPGSGKTHLLKGSVHLACAEGRRAIYADAADFGAIDYTAFDLLAIDNVEQLNAPNQIKLFNFINQVREGQGRLIAAGLTAPMQLPLRNDLTTRLGWGLIYQIHPLSDADKLSVLSTHAQARGFDLQTGVADYLIRHWRRDLPSLIAALDSLDRYSLQTQRPVTLPLLKEVLG